MLARHAEIRTAHATTQRAVAVTMNKIIFLAWRHQLAATRDHRDLALGVSPRGAIASFRAAQARAFLQGRRYVSPDDVQALAGAVLGHRVVPTPQARYGGATTESMILSLLPRVEVPT